MKAIEVALIIVAVALVVGMLMLVITGSESEEGRRR